MKLRFLAPVATATAIALAAPAFAQQSTPPAQGEGMRRMEQAREHMPDRDDRPARERQSKKRGHGGHGDHDGMHEMMHMMMMHHMMHEMMHGDDDGPDCRRMHGSGMMERHGMMDRPGMMERRGMMSRDGAPAPRPGMGAGMAEGRGQMRAQIAAELEEMRGQIARLQEMVEAMAAEEEAPAPEAPAEPKK